eukprot:3268040-Rhodomonas_salina.2
MEGRDRGKLEKEEEEAQEEHQTRFLRSEYRSSIGVTHSVPFRLALETKETSDRRCAFHNRQT